MGAWGHGILENDSTVNYLIEINALWNLNIQKEKIQAHLKNRYLEDGDDVLDYDLDKYTDFWTAIAFAEWMYDKPRVEVIRKIEKIVNSGKKFECWGEDQKRMQSIERFLQALKKPREKNEKRLLKIWFWENTFKILNNEFAQQIEWEYNILKRMDIHNKIEILKKKYQLLTIDFEEAIFWATIGKCESENGKISKETILKLEEIENNPNSMNLIKVAYNQKHRDRLMDSIKEIKN